MAQTAKSQHTTEPVEIHIRRQWSNAGRIGKVLLSDLDGFHYDVVSGGYGREGGFGSVAPRPFVHAYVYCDKVKGEIGHTCMHGPPPHRIKVCVVQKDNSRAAYRRVLAAMEEDA